MTQKRILNGQDYLSQPCGPDTWLIEPLLPSSGAMLLYAPAKSGKSFSALQMAQAIETGSQWLGFPCRKGSVVYIQLDTPRNVWQDRIRTLVRTGSMTHLPSFADRESLNTWPFNILQPDHLIMLRESLKSITRINQNTGEEYSAPPDVVVFDTLRESHQADENDSTEMQEVVAALVAATQPAAIVLIAHSRKPSQENGHDNFSLMNDSRGSNYVVGRMDAIVRFTPKSARIAGRSIEEHSLELERADSGFWDIVQGDNDMLMTSLLLDPTIPTIRGKAKVLSARIGKPEEACRGMIRRFAVAHPQQNVSHV